MSQSPPNPLREVHEKSQAEFQPYAELEIVSTFGSPQSEYSAIHKSAALMDLPHRGVLELTGRDRLAFLNNMLTNQTWDKQAKSGLPANTGVFAFFLNSKGRIVGDMNVLELGDRTLLEIDVRLAEALQKGLERYLFAEQVKIASKIGEAHRLALHGPEAHDVLSEVVDRPMPELSPLGSVATTLSGIDATIFRDDLCGVPGYQLIVSLNRVIELWNVLTERFGSAAEPGKRRLRPTGWAAFNACRIEAGTPLFDIDFGNSVNPDESTLPAETGPLFARAVSLTKGCYLGQEIVARMHSRQQLARRLVGLRMEGEELPIAGNPIFDANQNQIGVVTSSTVSPVMSNAAIALGYVKRPFFEIGSSVMIPAEGATRPAKVVDLPFTKP